RGEAARDRGGRAARAARLGPRRRIEQRLLTEELGAALQPLADTLGHADRGRVGRADEAYHALAPQVGERMAQDAAGRLGRVALAPRLAPQHPDQLEARPALRLEQAGPPHERAGR